MNWPTLDRIELTYWHLALSSQLFAQSSSLSAKKPWPPWSTGRSPPRISISSKMQPAKVCQLVCPLGRKASQPACNRGAETYGEMGTCPTKLLWTFLFSTFGFQFCPLNLKVQVFYEGHTIFKLWMSNLAACQNISTLSTIFVGCWIIVLICFIIFSATQFCEKYLICQCFLFWLAEKLYIEK